jgi:putative DNA primase/helicase
LVPFSRYFEPHERDPDLLVKLVGESPGILRWIVDGAVQWYANGLDRPEVVTTATEDFRTGSDELGGFIGSVIAPGSSQVLGAVVMDRYIGWCHEENVRPWSRRALFNGILERIPGAEKKRVSAGMALLGIDLVDGM